MLTFLRVRFCAALQLSTSLRKTMARIQTDVPTRHTTRAAEEPVGQIRDQPTREMPRLTGSVPGAYCRWCATKLSMSVKSRCVALIVIVKGVAGRWAPDKCTLQRNFHRLGLTVATAGAEPVFGRFEAEHPNDPFGLGMRRTAGELVTERRICSRSWMIIPDCCPATAGAMRRTPCGWPPRCCRRWPPAVSPKRSTSTADRRSSTRGCYGRARNSVWLVDSTPRRPTVS